MQPRRRGTAAEGSGGEDRSAQQGLDPGRGRPPRDLLARVEIRDLQVRYRCHRNGIGVQDLPVQQVQVGVEQPAAGGFAIGWIGRAHWPAPLKTIKGIAATAATMIMARKTTANMPVSRPFTSSPMYCGSLAMIRMGMYVSGNAMAEKTTENSVTWTGSTPVSRMATPSRIVM